MNTKMKLPLLKNNSGKLISSLTFLLCIWGQGIQPSWAEGSKELTSHDGDRPYIEWSTDSTATITRQTTLQVYVQVGETVNLGSSVPTSANNPQDIVYTSPSGGQNGSCDVLATGFGFIDTRAKELAGPLPNAGGYTPCSFTATETGIYKVQFRAPQTAFVDNNPTPVDVEAQFPTDINQRFAVAAWDITVRNSSGVAQTGRVFTNYVAMNVGVNPRTLNSRLYIQTKDGYRYLTDMNGLDPFGFVFFANSRGFIDNTNNSTVYHSIGPANNNVQVLFPGNVGVQIPTAINPPPTDVTHLIFFNIPDPATLINLGIPTTSSPPIVPTSFLFTAGAGGTGNKAPVGVGGTFSFIGGIPIGTTTSSYQIILDTNRDGIYDANTDRVLQNFLVNGPNSVVWDGKDAAGNNLPALPNGEEYNAIITTRAGEYHFPMLDAENNPKGIKITMENPPGPFGTGITATTVYYNDENYTTANGTPISLDPNPTQTASTPRDATTGVDSASGAHSFSGTPLQQGYGDLKGIDTWTYFSSAAILTPAVIIGPNQTQTNVQGTKSVRFLTDADSSGTVTVGDTVQYTITYSNLASTQDANNFVINDTLPSQLTFVSAAITNQTGNSPAITLNNAYTGTVAGSVALTNSGSLKIGASITITINATINSSNGGNPISNQGSASFTTTTTTLPQPYTVLTDATPSTGVTNPPAVGANFLQTADDGTNTGNNTISTADDDPTLFTVVSAAPKLLLVKRITRINGTDYTTFVDGVSNVATTAANYVAAPNDVDDNDPKWPANYLQGLINSGNVQPGDVLEYTIYFLSNGASDANKVKFCDLVPSNATFLPTAFNTLTPIDGGFPTSNYGIALAVGSTTPTVYLSNVVEDQDRGTFYLPNDPNTPAFCGSNTNGAVVVNITNTTTLTSLPAATTPGVPANSYGFVRFRVVVK